MSVPASYMTNLNNLGAAGVGALGTYAGINQGGTRGLQSALGAASKGAAGVGSFLGDSTGALGQASNTLGGAGNALGIVNGVQQGGVLGYGGAAINAGGLAGRTGALGQANSGLNQGVGDAASALGIYQGIKQGGVLGYGGAAVNAAKLGASTGAFGGASGAIGSAAGYIAAPLAVYNAVKNYKSGATGSDALSGAEAGAAVGSVIPGVGTLIGGVLGGLVGGVASIAGPGKMDAENSQYGGIADAYKQVGKQGGPQAQQDFATQELQDPYLALAGEFDQRGANDDPLWQQYGRMGEQKFTGDLTGQIQKAIDNGTITKNDDASAIYSKAIQPWEASFGKGSDIGANADLNQAITTQLISQYMGGQAPSAWKDINGGTPFQGLAGPNWGAAATTASPDEIAQTNALTASLGRNTSPVGGAIASTTGHAQGGVMKKKRRIQRFDDGGDVDFTPDTNDFSNYEPTLQDPGVDYSYGNGSDLPDVNSFNDPYAYGSGSSGSSNSASLASLLKTYAPVLPLIAGLVGSTSKGTSGAPAAPNGLQAGVVGPMPTPQFNRTQVANPTNRTDGQPMTQQDWYTYGSRPGASFFNNNQVPLTGGAVGQATQAAPAATPNMNTQPIQYSNQSGIPVMAKGGALAQSNAEPMQDGAEFSSANQQHVRGPGDGTSDDIPAKLSDGEYVFDANTVSMLGNGSNDAGARALDKLRENLRKHAAKPMAKGKQFMKAKSPEKYLGKGSK
jgi:hypothetical protein